MQDRATSEPGSSEFPPVPELIPHRDEAVLLTRVLGHSPLATSCEAVIRSRTLPLRAPLSEGPELVDVVLGLEIIAQAVAAHSGLTQQDKGQSLRAGYVVSVKKMSFFGGDFRAGDVCEVSVKPVSRLGGTAEFQGELRVLGQLRVAGVLLVHEPESPS